MIVRVVQCLLGWKLKLSQVTFPELYYRCSFAWKGSTWQEKKTHLRSVWEKHQNTRSKFHGFFDGFYVFLWFPTGFNIGSYLFFGWPICRRISAVWFLAGSPGRLKQVVDRNEEKSGEGKTCWSSILPLRIPENRPGLNDFGWVWTCMKRRVFLGGPQNE